MIQLYGVIVVTFMMLMYAFEKRAHIFILLFALGCALSSSYGFLSGAWPFGLVEAIWSVIAFRRWWFDRPKVYRLPDYGPDYPRESERFDLVE